MSNGNNDGDARSVGSLYMVPQELQEADHVLVLYEHAKTTQGGTQLAFVRA
jgi:hypothetical protein